MRITLPWKYKKKPIKQKGQEYVKSAFGAELLYEPFLYHPINRKIFRWAFRSRVISRIIHHYVKPRLMKDENIDDLSLWFCGFSHLDAAYRWTVIDSKIKAHITFAKAVEHCDLYPFFVFAQTSPQYYQWIKKYDRNLWKKVKQKVKAERINATGGMWLEPSLDMPTGESLVRHRLYGQLFYLREFGKISKISSLNDCFGFPWSLPQILIKSGAEFMWTAKILWNDTNEFPFSFFNWRGIDGTDIFVYQFKHKFKALKMLQQFRRISRFPKKRCASMIVDSHMEMEAIKKYISNKKNDYLKDIGIFYGIGDGGKGPIEPEILIANLLQNRYRGNHITQDEFMDKIRKEVGDRLLVWNDELYLEYHRGVKTTNVRVKHFNRRAELWVRFAEMFVTLSAIRSKMPELYGKAETFEMWRLCLFNQFHDILPGSSLADVYLLAIEEQKKAVNSAKEMFIHSIPSQGGSQLSLVEINQNAICVEEQKYDNVTGKNLLELKEDQQLFIYNPFTWITDLNLFINQELYWINDLAPFSLHTFSLSMLNPYKVEISEKIEYENTSNTIRLENSQIQVLFDERNGSLKSLILKSIEKNFISKDDKEIKSGFRVYIDKPERYDAWNIDPNYRSKEIPLNTANKSELKFTKAGLPYISSVYFFEDSILKIQWFIYPEESMLRFRVSTNLHNAERLVKFFIPLALSSEDVACEIPFGWINRKRNMKTSFEKAKWEMNMHKWIDISDEDAGCSILNNNRYGFNADMKGVYLTIVRTPKYPKPNGKDVATLLIPENERPTHTDMIPLIFDFALMLHKANTMESRPWITGYEFNFAPIVLVSNYMKIRATSIKSNEDIIEPYMNGIRLPNNEKDIIITAIKPSEWTGDEFDQLDSHDKWRWHCKNVVIRLVNYSNISKETILKIETNSLISVVEEVDLLERATSSISFDKNKIKITLKPFEIKTMRIKFK
ncbi:MAG: hypothetical protein GF364_09175 [Candidatus Lokiarchaeota archaeon]|nr:hypothetical protein [Candidatus Lokiarchaeota archaeon]